MGCSAGRAGAAARGGGRHLAAVVIVPVAAGGAVTTVLLLAGTDPAGAAVHGAGVGLLGLFFVAVAGLAGQVFAARSAATGAAVAVLGTGLLARMIGDGLNDLDWLRWLSPFGLLAVSEPYAQNRVLPLLILLAAAVVLAVAAVAAAGHRDVRGGLVAAASGRRPRLGLLVSVEAFAVRRMLRPLTGWALGIGAYYLLIGFTTLSVTGFLADNLAPTRRHEPGSPAWAPSKGSPQRCSRYSPCPSAVSPRSACPPSSPPKQPAPDAVERSAAQPAASARRGSRRASRSASG